MNRFERNHARKQIETLKLKNLSLSSGQIVWSLLGIITLPTIAGPYFSYGYIKQYSGKKKENREKIKELEEKIGKKLTK